MEVQNVQSPTGNSPTVLRPHLRYRIFKYPSPCIYAISTAVLKLVELKRRLCPVRGQRLGVATTHKGT